jgi:glycosyltransferase involved in cell wall biosynthesis
MIVLALISGGIYIAVIASFFYGWIKLKPFFPKPVQNELRVSVIIPVRNEQANLPNLIHALTHQSYPAHLIEIIVVDDHSSDESRNVASSLLPKEGKIIVLPTEKTGKKAALWEGLSSASGELLITTDADCIHDPLWIETIANYYLTCRPLLILAPVIGTKPTTIFEAFQQLEMLSLLGSTAGAAAIKHAIMCNGANLAFPGAILSDLERIYNTEKIASGDDMFVLEYLKKRSPQRIHFIKSHQTTVKTKLSSNLRFFFNQRRRWASKAKFYTQPDILFSALAVLQINVLLFIGLVFAIGTSNYSPVLLLLGLKSIVDLPFLWSVARFYKMEKLLLWFPLLQCIYFFYVSFTFLGSFTGNFSWKLRKLNA